jgi:putative transcriptional regulator
MKRQLFNALLASIEEAGEHDRNRKLKRGARVTVTTRLQEIRERAGLSQSQLATLLNVSVRTLQNWEQDRRQPSGPAKALLKILELRPEVTLEALRAP